MCTRMEDSSKLSREITGVTQIYSEKCVYNWKIKKFLSVLSVSVRKRFSSTESSEFTSLSKQGHVVWKLKASCEYAVNNEIIFDLQRSVVSRNVFKQLITGKLIILSPTGPATTRKFANVFHDVTVNRFQLFAMKISKLDREFLDKGDFSAKLEMTVAEIPGFMQDMPARFTANPVLKTIEERFHSLLETQRFSDLVVACEGQEFRVHKCILAARSSVLDAMLSLDVAKENHSSLRIIGLSSGTVKSMLYYIYTDEVDLSTPEEALNLYSAASRYQLPYLVQKCTEFLASNFTPEIAVDALFLACHHGDHILEEVTMDFIVPSHSCILNTSKWEKFTKQFPISASKILIKIFDSSRWRTETG